MPVCLPSRCERASAYLMSLGSCFQDVVQLKGGFGGSNRSAGRQG
jgi:predicted sulfurtransferase